MIPNMRIAFFLLWCVSLCAAPKAVIFDFGGVVAIRDRKMVTDYIHQTLGTNAAKDFEKDKLYTAIAQGEDFWQSYAHTHNKTLPDGWMNGLNERVKQFVRPTPGIQDLISELKARGYRVALLSNTTKIRSDFFGKLGLYEPFDPVIFSWQVNVSKPDPKIYEIMLEKLNLPATDCIFIDNRPENVAAANKLGIHGILFKSVPQLRRDLSRLLPLNQSLPDSRIGSLNPSG